MTLDELRTLYESALAKWHELKTAEAGFDLALATYLMEQKAPPDQTLDTKTWRLVERARKG